jgi:hypothetical protein
MSGHLIEEDYSLELVFSLKLASQKIMRMEGKVIKRSNWQSSGHDR